MLQLTNASNREPVLIVLMLTRFNFLYKSVCKQGILLLDFRLILAETINKNFIRSKDVFSVLD
jgi:hypothetical protein